MNVGIKELRPRSRDAVGGGRIEISNKPIFQNKTGEVIRLPPPPLCTPPCTQTNESRKKTTRQRNGTKARQNSLDPNCAGVEMEKREKQGKKTSRTTNRHGSHHKQMKTRALVGR